MVSNLHLRHLWEAYDVRNEDLVKSKAASHPEAPMVLQISEWENPATA